MSVEERVGALPWDALDRDLGDVGHAVTPALLTSAECEELIALYPDATRFRSTIDMARYRFGQGQYRYFAHPLPPLVATLRQGLYPGLAAIANRWEAMLGTARRYPQDLDGLRALCARHGQTKPTPLLLRYEVGGYNCLHQDLYGEVAFPLQVTIALSRRGVDYEGGESLLVEQRPRAQSRGEVITLEQGEALVFPTRHRPVPGARGVYRVAVRHGVSRLRRGVRHALGVIFHDAA